MGDAFLLLLAAGVKVAYGRHYLLVLGSTAPDVKTFVNAEACVWTISFSSKHSMPEVSAGTILAECQDTSPRPLTKASALLCSVYECSHGQGLTKSLNSHSKYFCVNADWPLDL